MPTEATEFSKAPWCTHDLSVHYIREEVLGSDLERWEVSASSSVGAGNAELLRLLLFVQLPLLQFGQNGFSHERLEVCIFE